MIKRDFQNRYLGTYFGLPWAFIQPSMGILVIWFVFTFGLRVGDITPGVPFIVWLVCGMVPWIFIAEALRGGCDVLIEYSYLLKKINIRASLIPLIKIFSAFIIHIFFILLVILISVVNKYMFSLFWFQVIYYSFAGLYLCIGVSYITSSINVFVRDVSQFIGVFIQLFFWITPIFWNITTVPEKIRFFIKLNPFYYVITGYRDAFIYKRWFWENYQLTIYFWIVSTLIFLIGAAIFRRLRPHFGDVL